MTVQGASTLKYTLTKDLSLWPIPYCPPGFMNHVMDCVCVCVHARGLGRGDMGVGWTLSTGNPGEKGEHGRRMQNGGRPGGGGTAG